MAFLFFVGGSEEFQKGDFIHGNFKEGEEFIERSLLGQEDVRRRGGDEKILWGRKRL
jgi:hypothetical protein